MRANLGLESTSITDPLHNARDVSRAVEHAHFAGHADKRVDERVVVGDHVLAGGVRGDGVFEGVGGALEEEAPERAVDEV